MVQCRTCQPSAYAFASDQLSKLILSPNLPYSSFLSSAWRSVIVASSFFKLLILSVSACGRKREREKVSLMSHNDVK